MRGTVLGILIVAGLVAVAMGAIPGRPEVYAGRVDAQQLAATDSRMIVESTVVEGRYQQVLVVDPRRSTMAVYHVELTSGNVELCCVRNISWDLQMQYFNGKNPLPPEIQTLLEQR